MSQFAFSKLKTDVKKIMQTADVDSLKQELRRLALEVKSRGASEAKHVEKSVREIRARVVKLQGHIESEVAVIRRIVRDLPKGMQKTSAKKTSAKTTKKTARRKTAK